MVLETGWDCTAHSDCDDHRYVDQWLLEYCDSAASIYSDWNDNHVVPGRITKVTGKAGNLVRLRRKKR